LNTQKKIVSNPFYTYGVLYVSERFRRWESEQGARYHQYRDAWMQRVSDFDPGQFPLNLNVEVTTRCNLACTFCTQTSLRSEQIGDFSDLLYQRLLEEGENNNLATVNLNGLGEPLLRKDMPSYIRLAKDHGVLDVMFHTNGTVMTDSVADSLISSGLDRIIFSVDSPRKATYESMRITKVSFDKARNEPGYHAKGFPWEKIVRNVRKFVARRDLSGQLAPMVRATMVMTDTTVDEVPDLLKLWQEDVDQITVQDLTWRTKLLDDEDWKNQESSALPTNFDTIRDRAIEAKVGFTCPYLYQSTYAFFGGLVIPCSNPNAREHMIMGDLDEESLTEIWNGKKYRELRKLHESGRWHEHPLCRNCEVALIELYKGMRDQFDSPPDRSGRVGEDLEVAISESSENQNRNLIAS
jgi:MoaA/NifB/PqqE/SkfB family radical SAM enzyme